MGSAKILFTGGSGLLGSEIKKSKPEWLYPTRLEVDVKNYHRLVDFCDYHKIKTIVHSAAFLGPVQCEENPEKTLDVNIIGTANVVSAAFTLGARIIYISTDYVYRGEGGDYKENFSVCPKSKYAWSKLGGECAVRMLDNYAIIRTSFGKNEFSYDGAYIDQWTSREPVSIISPKIIKVVESDFIGVINIGGKRQCVHDYAISVSPNKAIKKLNRPENAPFDTSLDTSLYDSLFGGSK